MAAITPQKRPRRRKADHPVNTARLRLGLTQQQLASRARVSKSVIVKLGVNGKKTHYRLAVKIAKALNKSVDELFKPEELTSPPRAQKEEPQPTGPLQAKRMKLKLTQQELAKLAGIRKETVRRMEDTNGQHRTNVLTAKRVADVLECTISDLFSPARLTTAGRQPNPIKSTE